MARLTYVRRSSVPGFDLMLTRLDWSRLEHHGGVQLRVPLRVAFVRLRWWHRLLALPLTASIVWRAVRG